MLDGKPGFDVAMAYEDTIEACGQFHKQLPCSIARKPNDIVMAAISRWTVILN
jgi:hypothetical protein